MPVGSGSLAPYQTTSQQDEEKKRLAEQQATAKAPSALTTDIATTRDTAAGLMEKFNNPQSAPAPVVASTPQVTAPTPVKVPTVTAAPVPVPTMAAGTNLAPAAQTGPVTVQRTAPVPVTQVGPMQGYTAQTMQAVSLDPAAQAAAQRAEAARIAEVERVQAAQVGGTQDQVRQQLMNRMAGLQTAADGLGGPSAAQAMLQKGIDTAAADAMGTAASARSYGRLAALDAAGRHAARVQGQGAADAAILRAKEQQDARRELMEALQNTRGQDITVGTTDAQLRQQAALANQATSKDVNLTQAKLDTDVSMQDAALGTDVSKFNAAAKNTRSIRQGELTQEADARNMGAINEASQFTAGEENKGTIKQADIGASAAETTSKIASGESIAEAGIAKDIGISNTGEANDIAVKGAELSQDLAKFNAMQTQEMNKLAATFAQQAGMTAAQLEADVAKFNAEIANRTDLKNADLTQAANIANLESELKTRGLNDAQKLAYLDAALKAQGLVLTADIAKAQIQQAKDQASKGFWGTVLATVGAVTGAALENSEKAAQPAAAASDVRMKKDIRPIDARASLMDAIGGSESETRQMLEQAKKAYAYKYKDPNAPGAAPGEHFGPMAQDLEKGGPVGKSLVSEGPNGMKMVDTGRAALVALTEIARIRDELDRRKGRAA